MRTEKDCKEQGIMKNDLKEESFLILPRVSQTPQVEVFRTPFNCFFYLIQSFGYSREMLGVSKGFALRYP